MGQKTDNNLLLISINIVALCHFLYPPVSWTLLIYLLMIQVNLTDDIKRKIQIISICSLTASFFYIPMLTDFFSAIALGISMNVGYRLNSTNSNYIINAFLALGVILGSSTSTFLLKYHTARDMVVMVCTLPNLFMAQDSTQKQSSKNRETLWFFSPFYDRSISYSIGIIIGIFVPISNINKPTKFLIISLILLMTIFVEDTIYQGFLSLIRGYLVYDQSRHKPQLYLLIGYILIDIFAPHYKFNYLFVGYLVISVMLWQKFEQGEGKKQLKQRPLEKPLIEIKATQNQNIRPESD